LDSGFGEETFLSLLRGSLDFAFYLRLTPWALFLRRFAVAAARSSDASRADF